MPKVSKHHTPSHSAAVKVPSRSKMGKAMNEKVSSPPPLQPPKPKVK